MNIKNYDEVVDQLRAFLPQYLQEHGINIEGHFSCIDPAHNDKTPSATITGDGNNEVFHCFGCNLAGNIFTAAHYLEGKPLVGQEFIVETLIPLAEKYKINIESTPLTEEQIYELDTYCAYRTTSEFITHGKKHKAYNQAVKERGWSKKTCTDLSIGCVPDYTAFRSHLKARGFTASFLDDVDLSRREIFGEDCLIFTIKDEKGRPVGFASRNLKFNGEKKNGSKYINQKHTGVKCNIYRKSERLFGLDRVLSTRTKRTKTVYVFEGYSDVATACEAGLNNTTAVGGTAFTLEQVQLLKSHGFYGIILCLDGDERGQERTAKLLDTVLAGHKDLSIDIVIIPEGMDPDDFIRAHGINKFKKLKKWSAFEWRLAQFSELADSDDVAKSMIPLIVNETSYIEQEKQCKILAKATGVSMRTLQADLSRLQNQREAEKSRERDVVLDSMVLALKKDPDQAEFALYQAQTGLFDLNKRYDEDSFSEEATMARLDCQKSYEELKDGSFSGFILGPDLQEMQNALCGEWKKDVWFCFAGKANCGKTSLMCKLIYEIAKHEENDALVIYHTIDDTTEQILPKFVCIAEGSKKLTLNQVMDPNYHANDIADDLDRQTMFDKRETGYSVVRELIRKGRIVIKDANDGASIAYADQVIRYYKERYPNRNIVYVLDNFHKLQDYKAMGKSDERVRFKMMSQVIKDLATKWHICIFATVEYKKIEQGKRGTNTDIGECLTGDTQIFVQDTYSYVRIDQIKQGMRVATLDDQEQKIVPRKVTKLWDKGVQNIYKVTTRSGRSVKTTINHPFFGENGWTKLSELQEGSWVGIPLKLPGLDSFVTRKNRDLARFLGYMAGDGSYISTPHFTNKTREYYEDVINIAEKYFDVKAVTRDHLGSVEVSLSRIKKTAKENQVTTYMKSLGIWRERGSDKTIPQFIQEGSLPIKSNYIVGLFCTDGSICSENYSISFANKSEHLIYGLQSMLLQFGIQSRISFESNLEIYKLSIKNRFIPLFAATFHLPGYKGMELKELIVGRKITGSGDVLPPVYTERLKQLRKESGKPVRLSPTASNPNGFWIQKPTVDRENAKAYIIDTRCYDYLSWVESDIYWDQIRSIEPFGREQTWDLTVEDTHNFVANDIFCHNTGQIEYDANFVMHIHNEMHELGDQAGLFHIDKVNGEIRKLPVIEGNVGKNKITAFKNKLFFSFWPENSDFIGTDSAKMQAQIQEKLEELHDNYKEIVARECGEKGHMLGRASWVFNDTYGLWPTDEWKAEFESNYGHRDKKEKQY